MQKKMKKIEKLKNEAFNRGTFIRLRYEKWDNEHYAEARVWTARTTKWKDEQKPCFFHSGWLEVH